MEEVGGDGSGGDQGRDPDQIRPYWLCPGIRAHQAGSRNEEFRDRCLLQRCTIPRAALERRLAAGNTLRRNAQRAEALRLRASPVRHRAAQHRVGNRRFQHQFRQGWRIQATPVVGGIRRSAVEGQAFVGRSARFPDVAPGDRECLRRRQVGRLLPPDRQERQDLSQPLGRQPDRHAARRLVDHVPRVGHHLHRRGCR